MTPTPPEPDDAPTFDQLGLREELLTTLSGLGYEEPTPIQAEAIPPLLAGRDLLGQAATGTGKTAAFALPLLQRWAEAEEDERPAALVLVPTRELAMQVAEAVHRYGRELGVRVLPIYGGQPIGRQLRELQGGVDVVVATPGRALDHIRRGTLSLSALQVAVLDEADEMLDMGFMEDIETILEATPEGRQTVLFSATLPARITSIAKRHLRDPVKIEIGRPRLAPGEAPRVRQTAYVVPRAQKMAALERILDMEAPEAAIVFCRTRNQVDELTETLNARGYRAEALHGGMDQHQRDRVMGRLRGGAADLLIATDVAARGLDVEHLSHVVNYDVPSAPDAYVHRIGRVGRAGREGVAITLAEPREHRLLKNVERVTKRRIQTAQVPTVADLRARRLELTRATLRETVLAGDLDHFRVVVETLAEELDVMDVAAAAVKMAHEATRAQGEIPQTASRPEGPERTQREARGRKTRPPRPADGGPQAGTTRIYVGAGRQAGIRPGDLVGAIANESSLSGGEVGAIEITDRFSLVEVPEHAADEVIESLRSTSLRGKRPTIRRERY